MKYAKNIFLCALGCVLSHAAPYVAAQPESQLLTQSTSTNLGYSIAASGNYLAVGAPDAGGNSAKVWVYQLNSGSWSVVNQLSTSGIVSGLDEFGSSLAMSGDLLLVGAPEWGSGSSGGPSDDGGRVFTYKRNTSTNVWEYQSGGDIPSPSATSNYYWGFDVAIDGNYAAVSSPTGKLVNVYQWGGSSWTLLRSLSGPAGAVTNTLFGAAIDIDDGTTVDRLVVGSPNGSPTIGSDGIVYVYDLSLPNNQVPTSLNATNNDALGESVAIDDTRIVAGSPSANSSQTGTAEIWHWGGSSWSHIDSLSPCDPDPGADFGLSVEIAGDLLVVGAPEYDPMCGVYVFRFNSGSGDYSLESVLTGSDTEDGDSFGFSTAIVGTTAFVGAPNYSVTDGAAYVFDTAAMDSPIPAITTQPANQSGCNGANVAFGVSATGYELSYQWQRKSPAGSFTNVSGATSASLPVTVSPSLDGYQYRVLVSGLCGSTATSSAATLTYLSAPSISVQPQSQSKCVGGIVSFSITSSGSGSLTYQWQTNTSGSYANISGATASSYSINPIAPSNAGQYRVIVTNGCGNITSSAATLSVVGVGSPDCNGNGTPDACDIAFNPSTYDCDSNGVLDQCQCAGDVNGDKSTNGADQSVLLANFGMASGATRGNGDLNGDGAVNGQDLSILLANFGCTVGC